MNDHNYYIYLTTNKNKTVLYTGVTGALVKRINQHIEGATSMYNPAFTARYNAYYVVYYEHFRDAKDAIAREKQIKGWTRAKKEALIKAANPDLRFLNHELLDLVPANDDDV